MKKYRDTATEIIFDNEKDLESLRKFKKNNYGCQADLYYLRDAKEILKVYKKNTSHTDDFINFAKLKNVDTKTLIKFKKLLFINKKYSGYSMDKVVGTTLYNIDYDNIRDILNSLKDVETDIKLLGENSIVADDINLGNIIYNRKKNESKLVDVNSYIYLPDENSKQIKLRNCIELYNTVLTAFSKIPYNKETNIGYLKCIKQAILENDFTSSDIYNFFNRFLLDLESFTNEEIVTTYDFATTLKKSRNFY